MNIRSTLSRAVALALLAAPVAVLAGPAGNAQAATTTLSTMTTISLDAGGKPVKYGKTMEITGAVKDSTGASVYDGVVELQAMPYGSSSWTTIATDDASGFVAFYDVKPTVSTAYRLHYQGYTATSSYEKTYAFSDSTPATQPLYRNVSIKSKGTRMYGKVTPAAGRMKIVFKLIKHKKLHKWFTVKTKKNGKWSKVVHGKVGTQFMVISPASPGFVAYAEPWHITLL